MSARSLWLRLILLVLFSVRWCFGELTVLQRPTQEGIPVVWGDPFGAQAFNIPPNAPKLVGLTVPGLALGLTREGSVSFWGDIHIEYPELWADFPSFTNVVKIAAVRQAALLLREDGKVFIHGTDIPPVPADLTIAVDIALSDNMVALALLPDGTVRAWTKTFNARAASPPRNLTNVVSITSGYQYFGAVKADGSIAVWGDPESATFGQPNLNDLPSAVGPVKALAFGVRTAYALRPDGSIISWGDPNAPAPPPGLRAKAICAGYDYVSGQGEHDWAMALQDDGTVVAWGADAHGVVSFANLQTNAIAISGGYYPSILKAAEPLPLLNSLEIPIPARPSSPPQRRGRVVAWGSNESGQLNSPAGSNFVAISAGLSHTLALKNDGAVTAWGLASDKQTAVPPGLTNVVFISAGYFHSLALKRDGSIAAWGRSQEGEISVPSGPNYTNITRIAAGNQHSEVVSRYNDQSDIVGWGFQIPGNAYFTFANPFTGESTNFVDVTAGYFWSCGLRNNGTIFAWGRDNEGQSSPPLGLNSVVAISAGYQHAMALRSDGTVVCWGRNSEGQCNVPAGLTNVVAIAGGSYHSVALRRDGTVVAWGGNSFGQLPVPANLSRVFAITAGTKHTVALVDPTPEIEVGSSADGRVTLTLRGLIGQAYQLESSTTLSDWMSEGDSFMADRATVNRDVELSSPAKFYRLRDAQ